MFFILGWFFLPFINKGNANKMASALFYRKVPSRSSPKNSSSPRNDSSHNFTISQVHTTTEHSVQQRKWDLPTYLRLRSEIRLNCFDTWVRKFNSITHGESIYCLGCMSFPMGVENLDFCSQLQVNPWYIYADVYIHARSIETGPVGANDWSTEIAAADRWTHEM